MTVERYQGAPVLAIQMLRAAAPVSLRGRYFRRVGNSSREVPAEELPRFLLELTGQSWDALPCEVGLEGLDGDTVHRFVQLAQERLPEIVREDAAEAVLQKLRLIRPDGRLLRAAALLFGKEPQRQFLSAAVQVGRFKGSSTIIDDKRIEGNLFQQLEQAEQALRQYLLVRYDIPSGTDTVSGVEALRRNEVWEYPFKAIREAIMNALVHRDYTKTGRVQIHVFDDRVVISNPGALAEGLTVEKLYEVPHPSMPRNPVLAQVLYYTQLVEQWGTGTTRMVEACRAQVMPEPQFVSSSAAFTVTLYKDPYTLERMREWGLTEAQIRAVQRVRQQGEITNREYRALANVSAEAARQSLRILVDRGILQPAGHGRSVRYVLRKLGD